MSATVIRVPFWSQTAIAHLRDSLACPLCGGEVVAQRCPQCHADYTGEVGGELWDASQAAATALEARQTVLDRVPIRATSAIGVVQPPAPRTPAPASAPAPARSSATVQSVLAVAGAGLVAVAAIVFAFFNPDVTDALVRGLIVAAVTVVFLLGARVLARRGLQFSAEAVGALGLVFLGLDVQALTALVPENPWAVAAAGTAIAGAAMVAVAVRIHIRVWIWAALTALALVPAMIGFAANSPLLGYLGTALAAFVLVAASVRLEHPFGVPLRGERTTLTAVQLLALAIAIVRGALFGELPADTTWWSLCVMLAGASVLAMFSTRHPAPRLWSYLAGAFGVAAVAIVPPALATAPGAVVWMGAVWMFALVPTAAVIGALAVGVLLPVPRTVHRGFLVGGVLTVVLLIAVPLVGIAGLSGLATALQADAVRIDEGGSMVALTLGLTALAAGLVLFGVRGRRRWIAALGLWFAGLSALNVLSIAELPPWSRVLLGCAFAVAIAVGIAAAPRLKRASPSVRIPLIVAAHALVVFAALLAWHDLELAAIMGALVVAAIAAVARTVAASARFVHVGVGYAYALAVFATALSLAGVSGVALLCLTTSAGAVAAIAATFARGVPIRSWYAVLVVTSVPFLIGVVQVVFERSGWTALSTGLIFLLALTLVVTRRAGLGIPLRLMAAAILVPSLAVVIVCLGAQLLVESGSPVVLPTIAVIVALVLPTGPVVRAALAVRIGERDAALVRVAIEASTLLAAAIAVLLALVREAAGLPTTLVVLVVLAIGGAATAVWGQRRYGWALAGAAATGALWCAWGIVGVDILEPYLLPPTLGAALVGAILTVRGRRALALYASGLLTAVVPLAVVAAIAGPPVRALGLVVAAWALLAVAGRFAGLRSVTLRSVTLAAAIIAGSAGAALGVRLGLGIDSVGVDSVGSGMPLVLVCLGVALAGAVPAAWAARTLRARSRWLYAPALAYVAVGSWTAIRDDWFTIWAMWTLMVVLLVILVVVARRGLRNATGLPPVWFVFGLAFATAIVAWSPRELRVEWFSLPLGTALLVAGALAMRGSAAIGPSQARRSLSTWPSGWRGSWALLAPGMIVALSASVTATFTDPLTWRAILVIVLALVAILVGASRRLAAPFLIGIIVLPVENAIAFLVQIGRGIQSMPWWITLAIVGAVLLIIAVTYERRSGEGNGLAARLRDLV